MDRAALAVMAFLQGTARATCLAQASDHELDTVLRLADALDEPLTALVLARGGLEARQSLAAREDCPDAALLTLAADKRVGVQRAVLSRPSLAPEVLWALLAHDDAALNGAVFLHASAAPAHREHILSFRPLSPRRKGELAADPAAFAHARTRPELHALLLTANSFLVVSELGWEVSSFSPALQTRWLVAFSRLAAKELLLSPADRSVSQRKHASSYRDPRLGVAQGFLGRLSALSGAAGAGPGFASDALTALVETRLRALALPRQRAAWTMAVFEGLAACAIELADAAQDLLTVPAPLPATLHELTTAMLASSDAPQQLREASQLDYDVVSAYLARPRVPASYFEALLTRADLPFALALEAIHQHPRAALAAPTLTAPLVSALLLRPTFSAEHAPLLAAVGLGLLDAARALSPQHFLAVFAQGAAHAAHRVARRSAAPNRWGMSAPDADELVAPTRALAQFLEAELGPTALPLAFTLAPTFQGTMYELIAAARAAV